MGFFKRILTLLSIGDDGKSRPISRHERSRVLANKTLQGGAKQEGIERRLAAHQRSVETGYDAKIARVKAGRGRHTYGRHPHVLSYRPRNHP